MDKKIILTIGILLLIVIAGCKDSSLFGGFGKKDSKKNPITDVDVRKGTTGLEMSFIPNAPPGRVFENGIFPVSLKLKNSGAADIKDGLIAFGLEKAFVEFDKESENKLDQTNKNLKFSISGKSIYNPQGDQDFKELNVLTKKIGPQSETHPSTILATACYPYKTILGTSVCIDPDVIGAVTGKKACEIKELAFSEGQGAPVTITKIETRMLPVVDVNKVKPHFIIYIVNKGNGEVVNGSKLDKACSSAALNYADFNTLNITASLPQGQLNCNENKVAGPTTVRLKKKEDMVRCTLDTGIEIGRDAYTSPLRIELDYGYTFTISKDIIIEKILRY